MKKDNKGVVYWLLTGCLLIFIMVLVGGITRLTHSGLSITTYKLIEGTLPPINEVEWQAAFNHYKQYPEYQKINSHFTLEDFKDIYFWEWLHRFIGRLIGIVFILPFIYFLVKKQLSKPTIKKALVLLGLGAFQGFLGWYMVKSGMIDRPDVSHYRLAMHLITAFITFSYTLWVVLDIVYPHKNPVSEKLKKLTILTFVVVLIQIIWGAFVAGLDAGLIHNFWPLMSDGKLIHESVFIEQEPVWKNFVEGKSGVQFIHRYIAYVVVGLAVFIWLTAKKLTLSKLQKKGVNTLLLIVFIQFLLGIFTLLFRVPVVLGVLHQIGAFLLLAVITFIMHEFSSN